MRCDKRFAWLTIILIAGLLLTACGSRLASESAFPTLRIGFNPWVGYGPLYIAEEKGFFEQEGITVELVNANYDEGAVNFAMKQLDGNSMVFSDSIAQAAAGVPVQAVWIFDNSAGGDVVVGSAAIEEPADLRGLRVGFSYGTFSHLFVLRGLANYGLNSEDVTVVNLPQADIPAALARGEIDAGHTVDPYLSEALTQGGHVLFSSAETPGVIVDALVFQAEVIEERPDDVQAVVHAIANATDWWQENLEEGNTVVAAATGIPSEDMAAIMSGVQIFGIEQNRVALDPATQGSESIYESAQFASTLFTESEIIEQAPDLNALINPAFVQALTGN
jgi:NitT/TauT family transport system substrate-binding protein